MLICSSYRSIVFNNKISLHSRFFFIIIWLGASLSANAQTDWYRLLTGAIKAGQAYMITDEQLAEMVKSEVEEMDRQNEVCPQNSKYAQRLKHLTGSMKDANGIKLNFKVYQTTDYNAFACPDGSVRVFSALMDILNDNELLGVIGHEIGHVALRHSKKAWQDALLRSAASDVIASKSSTWAGLSDSYLGDITSAALSAKHSRWHETQADDYGYEFLKKNGKNPWAMGLAFKKLKDISQQKDHSKYEKLLEAFSSHLDFDERINRMRSKAEKDGYICN
jgi:putative metalloprotease